jgi:hypothetical protein
MTVGELMKSFQRASPEAEVLVRVDPELVDYAGPPVFAVLSCDYSPGCAETYAMMLDCGQPEEDSPEVDPERAS